MKIIILICFLSISLLAQSKDSTSYKIYKKDFEQVIKERQEYDNASTAIINYLQYKIKTEENKLKDTSKIKRKKD